MKIISWNCNGAFRKKYHALDEYDADLLIIQECENPAESTKAYEEWAGDDYLWIGSNKNKGLGVFSRTETKLSKFEWPNDNLELFLPFTVSGISMIAVWTKHANSPTFQYIGQVWKYMQLNKELFVEHKPFLIGDFNSNAVWDKWDRWDRWWNHSDVVRELSDMGIQSLYHHLHNEEQGKESLSTFYMHRNLDKPYHIDYAFLPSEYIVDSRMQVGDADKWLELSDHLPLLLIT